MAREFRAPLRYPSDPEKLPAAIERNRRELETFLNTEVVRREVDGTVDLPAASKVAGVAISTTAHAHAVDDLTDAVITTPADNSVLAYDSGTSKWIDQTATEAGLLIPHGAYTAVTYLNSWVDYGAGWLGVAYMKDNDGLVTLRGMCKSGTAANAPIFTLPTGFRPSGALYFPAISSAGTAKVVVTTAGSVYAETGGHTTYQTLNGIAFHV